MAKIGIDFGSFQSVVATRSVSGNTNICVNDVSNRATPTMVALEHRRLLIGEECETRINSNLKQSVTHLVESLLDVHPDALWELENGAIPMEFNCKKIHVHVDELLAMYLEKLVSFAQLDDKRVSIALPDWYTQEHVDVVHRAATLANLQSTSYVRHSDALCAQYQKKGHSGTILLIDVGFGQTTCVYASIAEDVEIIRREAIRVGTKNLIEALARLCIARAHDKYKQEVTLRSKMGFRLRQACQKALKQLSMSPTADIQLECWLDDDIDFAIDVTRENLADAAQADLEQIAELIKRIKGDDTAKVEIVGGGSRAFVVKKLIASVTGVTMDDLGQGLDGSSAVASGACCCAEKSFSAWTPAEPTDLDAKRKQIEEIQDINGIELSRLEKMNALEGYIYEARDWCTGKDKDLLNCDESLPYLESAADWFRDNCGDDVPEATYVEKLDDIKSNMESWGEAFFTKKAEEKQKVEQELEELQKVTDTKEKEDHDYRKLPKAERIRMAAKNRQEGNEMFKAANLAEALIRYQKAQSHLSKLTDEELSPEQKTEKNTILVSCHLNSAQCYLKGAQETESADKEKALQIYKKAKASCNAALEIDDVNVKALFRRATALEKLGDFDSAMTDLTLGLKVDPENAELKKSEARVQRAIDQEKKKAKKMYGKMFG